MASCKTDFLCTLSNKSISLLPYLAFVSQSTTNSPNQSIKIYQFILSQSSMKSIKYWSQPIGYQWNIIRIIYFLGSSIFKLKYKETLVLCTRLKAKFKFQFIKDTLHTYLIDPCPQNSLANWGRKEKWKKKTLRVEIVMTITKNRYTNINFWVVWDKIISTQHSLAQSALKYYYWHPGFPRCIQPYSYCKSSIKCLLSNKCPHCF